MHSFPNPSKGQFPLSAHLAAQPQMSGDPIGAITECDSENLSIKSINTEQEGKPRPFLKWVGGKRQLLDVLHEAAPTRIERYFEPFIGGGAFLFSMLPNSATISDANPELVNCYQVIRDDVDSLIHSLKRHKNEEKYFYEVRAQKPLEMNPIQRASRFIFLNKTCFNGLYRENRSGQFNTPFGKYINPKIADTENLHAISYYLNKNNIEIVCADYTHVLDAASAGDFIYFDPPYAPLTKTASFSSYIKDGFSLENQAELAGAFSELSKRGVKLMLSNSNVEVIRELYKGFNIRTVYASRSINCKGNGRSRQANEVLITNY